MDFGTLIFTKPERAISDVKYAEDRGFSHAWIPDSHMIWGDTYACMALAAVNTKKIKLGTGVAIATNRIPPVTVHSIATINQLAPGRVILGFGTGHTGRRVMGLPPVKHAEFREQVRVIRDLLQDGEAIYNTEGLSRKIRYLHRDRRFINLDDRIPLYVAANGPKTLALAGEFGDGAITTGITDTGSSRHRAQESRGGRGESGTQRGEDAARVAHPHLRFAAGRTARFAAREGDDRALGHGELSRDRGGIRARGLSARGSRRGVQGLRGIRRQDEVAGRPSATSSCTSGIAPTSRRSSRST